MRDLETDGELIASSLDRPERFEAIFERHASSIHRLHGHDQQTTNAVAETRTASTGVFLAERGISLDPGTTHAPVGPIVDWTAIAHEGVVRGDQTPAMTRRPATR